MQFIQREKLHLENNPTASSQLPTKNEMRQYLDRIPSWLKNKYVLTVLCFGIWVLFIDDRDFVTTHFRHVKELHKLEARKVYFEEQIKTVRKELDQLKSNPATLEKYARERYLMKRDNEDLFVVK
jgi:cell division protein DivIC